MRRTKQQAAETRATILASAEALFLEQGFENVSLDEIATAAGVTRGAIHWHFRNKLGLLMSLRDEAQKPLQELAERMSQENGPASFEVLGRIIADIFEKLQADPRQRGLIRMIMRLEESLSAKQRDIDTFHLDLHATLVLIFKAVTRDRGLSPPWTPETAAAAFGAAVSGMIGEWARGSSNFRLVPDAQEFMKMILNAWCSTDSRS